MCLAHFSECCHLRPFVLRTRRAEDSNLAVSADEERAGQVENAVRLGHENGFQECLLKQKCISLRRFGSVDGTKMLLHGMYEKRMQAGTVFPLTTNPLLATIYSPQDRSNVHFIESGSLDALFRRLHASFVHFFKLATAPHLPTIGHLHMFASNQ
ncbi:unnamed protein product [Protopolystoma xenopodis]|uniref:Uncharacterized protein n=1 Tax=Protopolystoma xenopodis TaxID=117903 RepID=A0A448WME7_9PLAT|nr:unnamed protein product [Protopolystoma xenopodis]